MEYLEVHSEIFDDIVEDIKQRNLSRNNMPKIIVGTGLSVIYGVPGMKKLAEHLAKEITQSNGIRICGIQYLTYITFKFSSFINCYHFQFLYLLKQRHTSYIFG